MRACVAVLGLYMLCAGAVTAFTASHVAATSHGSSSSMSTNTGGGQAASSGAARGPMAALWVACGVLAEYLINKY